MAVDLNPEEKDKHKGHYVGKIFMEYKLHVMHCARQKISKHRLPAKSWRILPFSLYNVQYDAYYRSGIIILFKKRIKNI